jgi:hypothetical protein
LDYIYAQFTAGDIQNVGALLSYPTCSDSVDDLIVEAMEDYDADHPDRLLGVNDALLSELINNLTEKLNRFSYC